MKYKCLRYESYLEGSFLIRPVLEHEIEDIRKWRNSQMTVLRQSRKISTLEQKQYFAEKVWPEFELNHPEQILFSILHDGRLVGYGGLVHVSWANCRAEVSFLLAPQRESDSAFRDIALRNFLLLVSRIAFGELGFYKLTTETFEFRTSTINALVEFGFRHEGRLEGQWVIDGQRVDSYCHALFASSVTFPSGDPSQRRDRGVPSL